MTNVEEKNTITACVDGSGITASVVDAAVWASSVVTAPLQLLHVLEKAEKPVGDRSGSLGPGTATHLLDELTELDEKRGKVAMALGTHMLEEAERRANSSGVSDVFLHQRHGDLLDALLACEAETQLFVIGSLGEDHEQHSHKLGAHLESLVRAIQTPILVSVGEFKAPTNYMLAYDGSRAADKAFAGMASTSLLKSVPGHVVMVGTDDAANRSALSRAADALAASGHDVETHLIQGNVVDSLMDFRKSHELGLTVMGAYGHSRVRDFFVGSNTSRMIRASNVPLLLLR